MVFRYRTLFLLIELEEYRAWLALLVRDIGNLDFLAGLVVGNLLLREMCVLPLGDTLGIAVGIDPRIALLLLLFAGLLLFERLGADKLHITLVGVVLQVTGELAAVVQLDLLAFDDTAVFEDADFLHRELGFADFVLDVYLVHRHGHDVVCQTVDADKALFHFPGLWVGKLDCLTEIPGFEKLLLVLFCELVSLERHIESRLVLDEVRHKTECSVRILLKGETGIDGKLLVTELRRHGEKLR